MNSDKSQPQGAAAQSPQQPVDYSKPVAYDQQGNPLYAHPPQQQHAQAMPPQTNAKVPTAENLGVASGQPWLHGEEGAEKSLHYLEAENRLSSEGRSVFKMIEFDDREDLVTEIRKHWFGLFLLWVVGLSATFVLAGVPALLATQTDLFSVSGASSGGLGLGFAAIGLFLGLLSFGITLLLGIMFTKNVIFVTTDKVAQVKYSGLIHRKISQLGIGDVQDVTVHQNTIPSRIFNYGTLVIETAGEQNNYTFQYVPNPYKESKAIIWAREENVKLHGN